ncbi:4'-phosphopantetheinyl transferase superfamily protein [Cytobacillus pseudoceanisediminis]|uniref:4'-phosphopantetheinyl transferase superfamily protein n=1 Tax=Cytobacillus pseudoceanisediminis TaxID=3051614 RepID=A0ABZ2ZMV8_9BACI
MVEIYGVFLEYQLDKHKKMVENLKKYLSLQKLIKIQKLVKQEDQMRSIVGDILIRWLVCKKFKLLNRDLEFTTNEYGKPYILNKNIGVDYSISHSGSWVVLAVSPHQVGIDIEKVNNIDIKFAKQFFTYEEYQDLINVPSEERLDYFYVLWTLKESYVKAKGKGLSIPLDSFSIKINNKNIIKSPPSIYNFNKYQMPDNYKLAVCSIEKNFPSNIRIITLEELYFASRITLPKLFIEG